MSAAEVEHGKVLGLVHKDGDEIDGFPFVRRWVPAGQWETCSMGQRHASPWDALRVL